MTAAQYVLAMAYIARHKLAIGATYDRTTDVQTFDVYEPHVSPGGYWGRGLTLYEAVLDFQKKSGIGWGA